MSKIRTNTEVEALKHKIALLKVAIALAGQGGETIKQSKHERELVCTYEDLVHEMAKCRCADCEQLAQECICSRVDRFFDGVRHLIKDDKKAA